MTSSSTTLHELESELTPATVDRHRAIVSLMEELEAMDWYDQRVQACKDSGLRSILAHNRDEEKEHAAMLIEWLRRSDSRFGDELRDYLFTDGPVSVSERTADTDGSEATAGSQTADGGGSLGIGSLRGEAGTAP